MSPQDGITTLSDEQLERMLDRAAKRGAREALKEVGLGDENAGNDIHEVRSLLTAWRSTKQAIWTQVVKMVVTLILLAMAAGLTLMTWAYGGGKG
jgi:hypothetical protein